MSVGGEGARGEESQTHPELFIRHCSHHRCSHRHLVWVVGRGVLRASVLFELALLRVCVWCDICGSAVCVNGDLNPGMIFNSHEKAFYICQEGISVLIFGFDVYYCMRVD